MPVRLRQIEDAGPLAIEYRPIGSLIPYTETPAPTARRRWR